MSSVKSSTDQVKAEETKEKAPALAMDSIFVESEEIDTPLCKGYMPGDDGKFDFEAMLNQMKYCGFQATNLGLAFEEINKMLHFDYTPEPGEEKKLYGIGGGVEGVKYKPRACKIFMGLTSNILSSGMRDYIRFIVKHALVDVLCITAGGVEEDIIKCLAPTHIGEFSLDGHDLRKRGLNRIGNLVVPNKNYCLFEDWIMPILDKCVEEQKKDGVNWTPSKLIKRLGLEINNEDSVLYWAAKNNIPIYSPALTDGSIGDMIYFHSYNNPGFVLDLVEDIRGMNNEPLWATKTGAIILGGGVVKHHIMNANLYRNGADFSVYVNTAQEFDGSDSGARPDEAISWGKISLEAMPVKVYSEVTLVLPLIVAATFAKFLGEK
jgi:deoxyhypusine synthase